MRRKRHKETQVWHDPHLTSAGRKRQQTGTANAAAPAVADDAPGGDRRRRRGKQGEPESRRDAVRIVAQPASTPDPRQAEQERLLDRLLAVEGRPAVAKAAQDYQDAGFEFPRNQLVWLQLLEHSDERIVRRAIDELGAIVAEEAVIRRPVLESRLRRLEEFADDLELRTAARALRRRISGRGAVSSH
jgi:hypothetical protein